MRENVDSIFKVRLLVEQAAQIGEWRISKEVTAPYI